MPKIDDIWPGGYARKDRRGRPIFIIRRSISGKRYEVSTFCTSLRGAMKQLETFEADPEGFTARGTPQRLPVFLTEELAQGFLDWSRDYKKNSEGWRWTQAWCLKWWGEKLEGLDLRGGVSVVSHIRPAIESEKANQGHRIRVLKAFYGWLRKVKGSVTPAEDPTFGSLPAPQPKPEQRKKTKVIPKGHYTKTRPHLETHWRDAMDVQAATGWHVTETIRFAQSGSVQKYAGKDRGVAAVLVCPLAKDGSMIRTAVSGPASAAAKRLLKRGSFTYKAYAGAIKKACGQAKIEVFTPGRFRHTVATNAIDAGADLLKVSTFLNHKDLKTTKAFYGTHATPAKVPTFT